MRKLCTSMLLVACALVVLAAGASSASATVTCSAIKGAGSSLQKIAQREIWITGGADAFGPTGNLWKNSECSSLPEIEYYSTSSGKGMGQWGNNAGEELKEEELENKKGEKEKVFPAYVGTDAAPEKANATSKEAELELAKMDKAGGQGLKAKEGIVTVPVAQSAISVMVSLPVGCKVKAASKAKVKNSNLFQEWTHKKTAPVNWSTLIEGAKIEGCSGSPATLYARGSASGTTAGFKRFFASLASPEALKKEWAEATSTTTKALSNEIATWPEGTGPEEKGVAGALKGVLLEKGSQLAQATYETPNSIGYADYADANHAEFTTLTVKHTVGGEEYYSFLVEVSNGPFEKAEYASPANGTESNCSEAKYQPAPNVEGNADFSKVTQDNTEGRGTNNYPICTLTYDLAWHEYSKVLKGGVKAFGEGQMNSVYNYLKYIVKSTEGQAELATKEYGALPAEERKLAEAGLEKLPGEAGAVINF